MIFNHSGSAVAKQRHRISNNKAYDPQHSEKMKLKWMFASQFRDQGYLKPLESTISCQLDISLKIPASWSKKRKKQALGRFVTTRPDLDNYEKMYLDVLNGIAYKDDSQIAQIFSQKVYSNNPGVRIRLIPLEEDSMINEHAITFKDKLSLEDLNYIIKKANRHGLNNRPILRVYQEEDDEGTHVYFGVNGLQEKGNGNGEL